MQLLARYIRSTFWPHPTRAPLSMLIPSEARSQARAQLPVACSTVKQATGSWARYGGPVVHSHVASAAGPPIFRSVSAMFPQSFRTVSAASPQCYSLSAPFPRISAVFPQCSRSLSAQFPHYFRRLSALFPQPFRANRAVFPHCLICNIWLYRRVLLLLV